ncbi:MAG: site-specific integrase [Candidatus Thermoplasmatota archaeon]|nr:site-specific integrase [Candidatus Thermoplasmatota archaeon]
MGPFERMNALEGGRLERSSIPANAKKRIMEFGADLRLEGLSEVRIYNYMVRARKIAETMGRKFLNPSADDCKKALTVITSRKLYEGTRGERSLSLNTIESYKIAFRRFYKWHMGNNGTVPECVSWIKINGKPDRHRKPEDIISPEELKLIVDHAGNGRDRAIFNFMYDSGVRIGELLTMRIRDMEFDSYGAIAKVSGKTGYRQVRIVGNSIAYLRAWLNDHPLRNEPDAPLFCGISDPIRGRQLTYDDVHKSLLKTAKRAGIGRRIHPHLFRHTRATLLASKVMEAPLERHMGWVHGSRQTQTYVHLGRKDIDNAILRAYGKEIHESDSLNEPSPFGCPRCGELNANDAQYCRKCWLPLSVEAVAKAEALVNRVQAVVETTDVMGDELKGLLSILDTPTKSKILEAVLERVVKSPEMIEQVKRAARRQD